MAEVTKCGQLLSHFRRDINIYKVTNKQKESDERAKNTVIESLTNPRILQRFHKVNREDITKESTKHNFCGIWKINVTRKVKFEFSTKKEIAVSLENQSKILEMEVGEAHFTVKNNIATVPVIEKGEEELHFDYMFEYPDNIIDKKLNKYLEKHQEAIISANVDKKIAKWDKSCSLEQVIERLYVKDVFEFLEERIYAKPYDDKNKKDYKILDEELEFNVSLYLIPVISVYCKIKDEMKIFNVDAITREIRPRIPDSMINQDLIETVSDGLSEGVALFSPHKLLDEPMKKVTKKTIMGLSKLLRK